MSLGLKIFFMFGAHFIADYPLQGEFLAQMKGQNKYLLFCHSMIYATVITFAFYMLEADFVLLKGLWVLTTHYLIDQWTCNLEDKTKALTTDLYKDQAMHIIINIYLLLQ